MDKTLFVCMLLLAISASALPSKTVRTKPTAVLAPSAPEGLSLYSWKESDGTSSYALLATGAHSLDEITAHKAPFTTIEQQLATAKNGTRILWNEASLLDDATRAKLILPDATAYNRIRELAARARLHVTIAQ